MIKKTRNHFILVLVTFVLFSGAETEKRSRPISLSHTRLRRRHNASVGSVEFYRHCKCCGRNKIDIETLCGRICEVCWARYCAAGTRTQCSLVGLCVVLSTVTVCVIMRWDLVTRSCAPTLTASTATLPMRSARSTRRSSTLNL